MTRRREVPKRQVLPDPLYSSQLVTKFVNVVVRDGKKSVAERILYGALEAIKEKTQGDSKVFKAMRARLAGELLVVAKAAG